MGSYINVMMPLSGLIVYLKDLIEKYGIVVYLEKRDAAMKPGHVRLQLSGGELNDGYSQFFFSSREIPLDEGTSFYADSVFDYCVEGSGGRETEDDIELIKLRIISKHPDKAIQSFFAAVYRKLKKDEDMGMGVYAGAGSFYKNIFYLKSLVGEKNMWFDFKRKDNPISIHA
ncbi:hypothetical protein [Chitinophaga sp. RAB17]|uniref:hypothetical protein n=1 Tax=Chitinophaga sp. RAB17 TaxID=3233049 RepID=UPI003F8FF3E2